MADVRGRFRGYVQAVDGHVLQKGTLLRDSINSRLLPVRREGVPAMLKIAVEAEEKCGGRLMSWWNGQEAARVLAHEDDALLLERAEGKGSLADMARHGDNEATHIICKVVAQLHTPRERQRRRVWSASGGCNRYSLGQASRLRGSFITSTIP
jgi:streptomycin 6-kinase